MQKIHIALIVGSLRKDSVNRKLAHALVQLADADFTLAIVEIGDLPLYNQDEEASPTAAITRFRAEVNKAQGVVFITPEYNRSIPGVLKNVIDHVSRPYGKSVWAGKAAGVMGVSPGAIATALAQQHMRNILSHLDMPTLGQPEMFVQAKDGLFDADGNIGEASRAHFQKWMDRYQNWVRKIAL